MKEGYWIAKDAAYVSTPGLLAPWPKRAFHGEDGVYADSFNFYQSSHRIDVGKSFGILLRRWGLFWKPVQYHINDVLPILSAAMRLHNFCIENDGPRIWRTGSSFQEMQMETDISDRCWESASALRIASQGSQGTRRDLETSDLRTIPTRSLKEAGITRTACT